LNSYNAIFWVTQLIFYNKLMSLALPLIAT
jgi:hypothetical protein